MHHKSYNTRGFRRLRRGFTLIELVMVILLLAILAAIAIPNFIDFRSDAKNSATSGGVGALRAALVVATSAIALKEDPTIGTLPKYPSIIEMQANAFLAASGSSHPVLASLTTFIMDPADGIPKNPWSLSTLPVAMFNSIYDCNAGGGSILKKSDVLTVSGSDNRGWCYGGNGGLGVPTGVVDGMIWANSQKNGAANALTENTY